MSFWNLPAQRIWLQHVNTVIYTVNAVKTSCIFFQICPHLKSNPGPHWCAGSVSHGHGHSPTGYFKPVTLCVRVCCFWGIGNVRTLCVRVCCVRGSGSVRNGASPGGESSGVLYSGTEDNHRLSVSRTEVGWGGALLAVTQHATFGWCLFSSSCLVILHWYIVPLPTHTKPAATSCVFPMSSPYSYLCLWLSSPCVFRSPIFLLPWGFEWKDFLIILFRNILSVDGVVCLCSQMFSTWMELFACVHKCFPHGWCCLLVLTIVFHVDGVLSECVLLQTPPATRVTDTCCYKSHWHQYLALRQITTNSHISYTDRHWIADGHLASQEHFLVPISCCVKL